MLETTPETVLFFEEFAAERPEDDRWRSRLGVNYDVCHQACEFEKPEEALNALRANGIRLSKVHLSSALRVQPTAEVREALNRFADDIYLHQVIANAGGELRRYSDLETVLREPVRTEEDEWRIHFHVPLHMESDRLFGTTSSDVREVLSALAASPGACQHLEMETYTWGVLPEALRSRDVVEQLCDEYAWCLVELQSVGIGRDGSKPSRQP